MFKVIFDSGMGIYGYLVYDSESGKFTTPTYRHTEYTDYESARLAACELSARMAKTLPEYVPFIGIEYNGMTERQIRAAAYEIARNDMQNICESDTELAEEINAASIPGLIDYMVSENTLRAKPWKGKKMRRFTAYEKRNGELAARSLSKKAWNEYCGTDYYHIAERDGDLYLLPDMEKMTLADLNEFFESFEEEI